MREPSGEEAHGMQRKMFTVAEANLAIPRLTDLLHKIQETFRWLNENKQSVPYLESSRQIVSEGPVDHEYFRNLLSARGLLSEVEELGVLIKDLSMGLVDFPSRINGREVLLCWRLGEESVEFWHDLETGYAGRQPVPEGEGGSSPDSEGT